MAIDRRSCSVTAPRRNAGMTLIEMLLVVVVWLGVMAALIVLWQHAEQNRRITQLRGEVAKIIDVTHRLYPRGTETGYTGLEGAQLAASLSPPMPFYVRKQIFGHAFGGYIAIAPVSYTWNGADEANRAVQLALTGIPQNACAEITVQLRGMATAVAVGSPTNYVHAPGIPDATIDTINTGCAETAPNGGFSAITLYVT